MLTTQEEAGFVVVRATGTLTSDDDDRFVPAFEHLARERGPVAMLIDVTALESWTAPGLWRDLTFDATHQNAFGPMAIVGDERWQGWGTKLSKPFFKAEMRFFRPEQIDGARRWLRGSANVTA